MSPDNPNDAVPKDDFALFGNVGIIGQKIADRWTIVQLIGEGNLSTVYKAEEISTAKPIALKLIHKNLTASILNPKRLEQRAKSLTSLNHEHLSNFYDVYISDNQDYFLFCDLLQGETLEEMLSKRGHISIEQAIKIFQQAADGIDYAHQQKILHRDIKPSNIFLINDQFNSEEVKIVDFGIARLITEENEQTKSNQYITHTREIFGSVLYVSPEQCAGKKVDNRSDIYSLGCVMYEAINGKPPFVGKNVMETAYKHMNDVPSRISGPTPSDNSLERYQAIVFKALKKNPQERYQTMSALKRDLEIALSASDSQWQNEASAAQKSTRWEKRVIGPQQVPWAMIALILGTCLVLGIVAIWAVALLGDSETEDYPRMDNNLIWVLPNRKPKEQSEDITAASDSALKKLETTEQTNTKYSKEYEEDLAALCDLNLKANDWSAAIEHLKLLLEIQNKVNGPLNLCEIYAKLATCYFWKGDLNNAESASLETLKLAKRANPSELAAEDKCLAILGDIYARRGEQIKAKEIYLKFYGFWENLKQRAPSRYAIASVLLADTYRRLGQFAEAEQYYRNALDWWQNYVDHEDLFVAKALYGFGLVLKGEHRYEEADQRFKYALPLAINTTGIRSALVGAIKKESTDCLFHTNFWQWLRQKIKQEDESNQKDLPPLQLSPSS